MECGRQIDGDDGVPFLRREVCSGATCWMPALLTRMSRRPKAASIVSIISRIDAGFDMSAAEWTTRTSKSRRSATGRRRCSSGLPKPLRTISDPAAANARAMPRPIPLVEPVTSDTRPGERFPCGEVPT